MTMNTQTPVAEAPQQNADIHARLGRSYDAGFITEIERALGMDHDARLKIRNMVADTFERIVIYHSGADMHAPEPRPITVQLISKTGTGRLLNIHRKTGALLSDAITTEPDIPDAPEPVE